MQSRRGPLPILYILATLRYHVGDHLFAVCHSPPTTTTTTISVALCDILVVVITVVCTCALGE